MRSFYKRNWFLSMLMLVIVVIINLPIITQVLNSFRSSSQILMKGFFNSTYTFDNYIYLATKTKIWIYFLNSIIVTVSASAVSVVVSAMAGFALSRFKSRLVSAFSMLLLLLQMFPLILALISLYILFSKLSLTNTYFGIVLIYIAISLPFTTWMYKGFFDSIPKELEEASWIDGCTRVMTLFKIILPLSRPGMIAVSIYSFLLSWNEFMMANIFLRKNELMTIPVGIQMFVQQYSTDMGGITAATTLAIVPVFLFIIFGQKYLVGGAITGGVKG